MNIEENVPIHPLTTMKVGGKAKYMAHVSSKDEVEQAAKFADENRLPILTLGGGSNVIITGHGFDGLVIINELKGMEIDTASGKTTAAAGETWDDLVSKTVDKNLSGIEALSLIPGSVGATPVQNVGAYGQEIADTFVELEAYDTHENKWVVMQKHDCQFAYRSSIFKVKQHGRYIITSVTLQLSHDQMEPPLYRALEAYLRGKQITDLDPQTIRKAVIAIRSSKLPDPNNIPNTGSFFKNPHVPLWKYEELQEKYPDMPGYEDGNGKVKIPAGWLLEQAGFKDYRHPQGFATYDKHALVVINPDHKGYEALLSIKREIIIRIEEKFGIVLEQEPELIT